jgi:hypothetical protein
MKNHTKKADGLYHIKVGKTVKKFPVLRGSRRQVMNSTAFSTNSGKTKDYFKYNKHGRIVSKLQSRLAKKNKHLAKAGYTFKKGVFGAFKKTGTTLKAVTKRIKKISTKKKNMSK